MSPLRRLWFSFRLMIWVRMRLWGFGPIGACRISLLNIDFLWAVMAGSIDLNCRALTLAVAFDRKDSIASLSGSTKFALNVLADITPYLCDRQAEAVAILNQALAHPVEIVRMHGNFAVEMLKVSYALRRIKERGEP